MFLLCDTQAIYADNNWRPQGATYSDIVVAMFWANL